MRTKIITISDPDTQQKEIKLASDLIKEGQLVAFPTETVYGLGADAMNDKAVAKIFRAKNRPADNPLIVHISDLKQLKTVAKGVPKVAKLFMDNFWPGPLSIVLRKHPTLPSITTAGLDTVVVRFPSHKVARALIAMSNTPIAAPSANLSGKVSPTRAEHVGEDLMGKIPLIIDGGSIEFGLESTVVDCTSNTPIVLRPGSITLDMLQKVVSSTRDKTPADQQNSPGMKYRHYAPESPIILFAGTTTTTKKSIRKFLESTHPQDIVLLWHSGDFGDLPNQEKLPANSYEAAPLLFHTLRSIDSKSEKTILIQGYPTDGLGSAIMNRLEKAASKIIYT